LVVVTLVAMIAFVLVGNSVAARPSEIEQSAYSPTPTPTRAPEREPFVPPLPQISVTGIIADTPQAVAQAMGIRVSDIVSASLNGSDVRGVGIGTTPLCSGWL
jgi:hypothetical protein